MWKKKIAVLMAAAMITGMSGMTVFAEEQQAGGAPQMEQQAPASQTPQGEAPAGMEGQAPQGEAPANNGQQSSQGVAPQMEQKRQRRSKMDHGQTPQGDKGRASQNQAPQGNQNRASQNQEHGRLFIDFEACVKDGTISQETYDAIKKYMDENKPERPAAGGEEDSKLEMKDGEKPEDGEKQEKGEKAEAGEKPELPEDSEKPEKPDLLKDLLDAEVITQDEYDALAKRSDDVKEGSAQEEKAAGTEEDKPTAAEETDGKTTEESA